MLSTQGYVVKVQGKGTFVSEKKAAMQLNELIGFGAEMRQLGKVPTTLVLGVSLVTPSEKVAQKLNLQPERKIYVIERVSCADGVRMALERAHMPFSVVPGIDKVDLSTSLYATLKDKYSVNFAWATETLEATLATQKVADVLEIKANSPVLSIERVSYDSDDSAYEYTESIYRGDKYKFTVTMNR